LNLLLDTHILLWWLKNDSKRLSAKTKRLLSDPRNSILVSAASALEIAFKQGAGKLKGPDDLEKEVLSRGFVPLPITLKHAISSGQLPRHHADPFDRLLIAQAQLESCKLVTADELLESYGVCVLLV